MTCCKYMFKKLLYMLTHMIDHIKSHFNGF